MTEISEWAVNATDCLGCSGDLSKTPIRYLLLLLLFFLFFSFLRIQNMCKLLQLNYDPYPPLGLMSAMGLGLVAVASSLRLFNDKANFKVFLFG